MKLELSIRQTHDATMVALVKDLGTTRMLTRSFDLQEAPTTEKQYRLLSEMLYLASESPDMLGN